MREVQLYCENQRVDLFKDEQISITSSTQNFKDIAKTFTDYSQSFTIPASSNNNIIFSHWYENALDNGFNANTRVEAFIEINYISFRKGQLQLEEAAVTDGEVTHYKVTFYGDVVTLKDLFGEDKLSDLDYSGINYAITGANVEDAVDGTTVGDVMFPLISSERVWTHGDAANTDIGSVSYPIDYTELFPALTISKIFDLIESKYSVTFTGSFLTNDRFTKAYLWWKNRETTDFTSEPERLHFGSGLSAEDTGLQNTLSSPSGDDLIIINPVDYSATGSLASNMPANFSSFSWTGSQSHRIKIFLTPDNSSDYYIDEWVNNVYTNTYTVNSTTNQSVPLITRYENTLTPTGDTYKFFVRTTQATNFTNCTIVYEHLVKYKTTGGIQQYHTFQGIYQVSNITTTTNIDFATSAPNIKITDFFSGILKEWNLTCYPRNAANNFQVEPLADFYANGDEVNITPYVDVDEITLARPKLHKEINFEYKKTKAFLNQAYFNFNGRQYGDLQEYFPYDGSKYEIKVPFNHFLFQEFTGTDIRVSYCLDTSPDYKPFVPDGVLLYRDEATSISGAPFYFDNGSTVPTINSYIPFGSKCTSNTVEYSNNFGEEIDVDDLTPLQNSLYRTYYQPYLVNLFNPRQRIVTVKTILPLKILHYLTLDDGLLIRDKKYRINTMKTNLTTGEVKLELFQDFVDFPRFVGDLPPDYEFTNAGGTFTIPIKPPKPDKGGGGTVVVGTATGTPTILTSATFGTTVTSETNMTVTVSANTSGGTRENTFTLTYKRPDGTTLETYTFGVIQADDSGVLLTESSEKILTEGLDYLLEE